MNNFLKIALYIVAWLATIGVCWLIVWAVDEIKKEKYRDEADKERWLEDARDIEQEQKKAKEED